jgi:hypothetical protein
MNSKDNVEVSAATLVALRQESDAVRIITERLKVKQMGPADHIRTKHEVKAFIESGDVAEAKAIIERSDARRASQEERDATLRVREQHRQGLNP